MSNDQAKPNTPNRQAPEHQVRNAPENARKLGRDRPGEGLDTGVDLHSIQPGKTGGATSQ